LKAYINDILSNNYNYNSQGDDMTTRVHGESKKRHDKGASYPSFSEKLGRKLTFIVIFVLGAVLYASIPANAGAGGKLLFVSAF